MTKHEPEIGHDTFKADRPRIATYVYMAALSRQGIHDPRVHGQD